MFNFQTFSEFDNHVQVVPLRDDEVGLRGFIAVHRRHNAYPSLGATRLWQYETEESALRDALRLARLMTHKSALAGLPYGGAKAVLMANGTAFHNRAAFFRRYAEKVNELRGAFITGTDVGTGADDLEVMCNVSPYMIGRNIDAGYFTALGVFYGIHVLLRELFGSSSVAERTFAIQGLGKTGMELLKLLAQAGATQVTVSDLQEEKMRQAREILQSVSFASPESVHMASVDIFSPCALSGSINASTVPEFGCKAIAGSANNQLENPELINGLEARGILYAPDYVINAGGLISVVDGYEHGASDHERITRTVQKIGDRLQFFLNRRKQTHETMHAIADAVAAGSLVMAV